MVAKKNTIAEEADILDRAVIMQQLQHVLTGISEGADQIAARNYWDAYRTISHSELILSEIAYKLHELDLKEEVP
jgi:predicted amidohydrolase YtcJ